MAAATMVLVGAQAIATAPAHASASRCAWYGTKVGVSGITVGTKSVCVDVKGKGLRIDSFYGSFSGVERTCNPSLKWIVFDTNNRIQYQSSRKTKQGCYYAGGGYGRAATYKPGRACVEVWVNGVFTKRACVDLYR